MATWAMYSSHVPLQVDENSSIGTSFNVDGVRVLVGEVTIALVDCFTTVASPGSG